MVLSRAKEVQAQISSTLNNLVHKGLRKDGSPNTKSGHMYVHKAVPMLKRAGAKVEGSLAGEYQGALSVEYNGLSFSLPVETGRSWDLGNKIPYCRIGVDARRVLEQMIYDNI